MSNNFEAVFSLSELMVLLCKFMSPRDAARLGCTNRHFFEITMPAVWEHIDGVLPIFKLVDGCKILYYQDGNDLEVTSINLPNTLSGDSFARLRVYSSFIKSLDVFGRGPTPHYTMTNASALLSYTDHHELLPNLRRLTMCVEYSWVIAYFFWFRVFASRSLLEIRPIVYKYSDTPFAPVSVISSLVNSTLQRCPLVNTIGLFIRNGSLDESDHDLEHVAFTGNAEPLHQVLVQARTLVNVVGSAMLFDQDIFTALGRLPLLTRLEVRCESEHDDEPPSQPTHVEDEAFRSLKHVVLYNVLDSDIGFFWNMLPLVKGLIAIDITFHGDLASPRHHWIQRNFVPLMCRNSPGVTELRFDFLFNSIEDQPSMLKLSDETFRAISGLFLTKLDLSSTRLGFAGGIGQLATAWPEMEVLKWTAQHITLEELCLFAEHMPRLRHLALEIKMVPLAQGFDLERVAAFQQPMLRKLESGFHRLCEFTPEEGSRLRQYLSTLWPNVRLATRTDMWGDQTDARKRDLALLVTLNKALLAAQLGAKSSGTNESSDAEETMRTIWAINEQLRRDPLQDQTRHLPPEAM